MPKKNDHLNIKTDSNLISELYVLKSCSKLSTKQKNHLGIYYIFERTLQTTYRVITANCMAFRLPSKIVVLGSGVMGSQIALHFANAGFEVYLLDIVPHTLTPEEAQKGLTLNHPEVRNRIVTYNFQRALQLNPSPVFHPSVVQRVHLGNFEDDWHHIRDADWILEAIIEDLNIKRRLFERIAKDKKSDALVSTNTSGIPIHLLSEGMPEGFAERFIGTHFFNPPRYLRLLEVIPAPNTLPEVLEWVRHFGSTYLGKEVVLCKDTPAFIANRTGIYALGLTFQLMDELGLSIEEIDALTGPLMGRPKSATFRTADIVGIDTLVRVMDDLYQRLPDDEEREVFSVPDFIRKMVETGKLGAKSGEGFYKKIRKDGKREIWVYDIESGDYRPRRKPKFPEIDAVKQQAQGIATRLQRLILNAEGKGAEFIRRFFLRFLGYVSRRIPEISDVFYRVDLGLETGFAWQEGPFRIWQKMGTSAIAHAMNEAQSAPPEWVEQMLSAQKNFYTIEHSRLYYYDIPSKTYRPVGEWENALVFEVLRGEQTVWHNEGAHIVDLGDDVLGVELHTYRNAIGGEILTAIQHAIDLAEQNHAGVVIGTDAEHFSVGANVGLIFMMAAEQEWDELDWAVRQFQQTTMRIKTSRVPVVVAPHGMTLGGGAEISMHADAVIAAAELYMGLVELGAGLIPAGGGTKEMTLRASDNYYEGDPEFPNFQNFVLTIAQAKVSKSAQEAFDLYLLRRGQDRYVMNTRLQIRRAKEWVLTLANDGYVPPPIRKDIKVLGQGAEAAIVAAAQNLYEGGWITEYDKFLVKKLVYVMTGGGLSGASTVSEQYLLDLEREVFLSLCGERKTLERLQSILTTGKPLRN